MIASNRLTQFLKDAEKFVSCPYPDGGYYSVGYGHQTSDTSTCISQSEAEKILLSDIAIHEKSVNDTIKVPLTQSQFDALVSLSFNIGASRFKGSQLAQSINSKANSEIIKQGFRVWNTSQGQYNDTLQKRREKEISLYFWDTTKKRILAAIILLLLVAGLIYAYIKLTT